MMTGDDSMKTATETVWTAVERCDRMNAVPAPSLRVPVTANNREYLRWLRAVEASAWDAGHTTTLRNPQPDLPGRNSITPQNPPHTDL